ncbi:zinc finger FYVE domain-containing protein 26 [Protopterus annectens]|uniref:zinc finger FYVE domain-containing protein 26 n=1 Tax=Protopterus annectens TaxID=7888 RepID=UPI001CFC3651|nr:zinc finger FYVE domain-containing protein 26 [Protopterus annectens]XP_043930004.1 zinc finger FYVE domain-containing protein 26 [Protopterus annectens]
MHPFGREGEASLELLFEFFRECLQQGEWELARACLPQLHQCHRAGVEGIEDVLQALVCYPYLLRSSNSCSPHRLAWFWLLALEQWLRYDKKSLPSSLKKETEFLLLLEELHQKHNDDEIKELYETFLYTQNLDESSENKRKTECLKLSLKAGTVLKNAMSWNPRLVHELIGFLLADGTQGNVAAYNHSLQKLFVDYLLGCLQSKCHSTSTACVPTEDTELVYTILSLLQFNPNYQPSEFRQLCEELFDACHNENHNLCEERLLPCLLREDSHVLVNLYSSISTEKQKAELLRRVPTEACTELSEAERITLALFLYSEPAPAWKLVYFYFLNSSKHFLEQVLITAQGLLKREEFITLHSLLKREFRPLSRLLILLGWSHCQSLEAVQTLLCTLHKDLDLSNDSVLKDFCDGLSEQVEVLEWCLNQSREPVPEKDLLQYLHGLDAHSALYFLHHITELPALNEEEVMELLQRLPADGHRWDGKLDRLEAQRLIRRRNLALFHAFCALKYAVYALCASAHLCGQCKECLSVAESGLSKDNLESEETTKDFSAVFKQHFDKCQYYLQQLPAPFRLELLENIFSLLFLSSNELSPAKKVKSEDSGLEEEEAEEEETVVHKNEAADNVESSGAEEMCTAGPSISEISTNEFGLDKGSKSSGMNLSNHTEGRDASFSFLGNSLTYRSLNCLNLRHVASGLSGFLVDEVAMEFFLQLLHDNLEDLKPFVPWKVSSLIAEEDLKLVDCLNCSITSDTFGTRLSQLAKHISEARWRFKVVMSNKGAASRKQFGVKSLNFRKKSRTRRQKADGATQISTEATNGELSTSASDGSVCAQSGKRGQEYSTPQRNVLIPMMLSTPESLLISCILRGNFVEAHQVVLMFGLEASDGYKELLFMEQYQEVIAELARLEQQQENHTVDATNRKVGGGRCTLQAIGHAAAAGMVFYSISDVVEKLLTSCGGPSSVLLEDFWLSKVQLEQHNPLLRILEALNPSRMVAFDLACSQSQLWKTCKQLLEIAERKLHCSLESRGHLFDSTHHHDGIQGFPAVIQQISKLINHTNTLRGQSKPDEIDEKVSAQFSLSIRDLLMTCYPAVTEDCIAVQLTLSLQMERTVQKLRTAIDSIELRVSLLNALMEQSSLKPQELEMHPVRSQMKFLLKNLDQLIHASSHHSADQPDYVRSFFDYVNTLAAVLVKSINSDSDLSAEVKLGNPFLVLRQSPSQLLSHLLFERQVPPDKVSFLLEKAELNLSVLQVIVDYCCETLSLWSRRTCSQTPFLIAGIDTAIQHRAQKTMSESTESTAENTEMETGEHLSDSSPSSPGWLCQYTLTPSALAFLKSHSRLLAAVACLGTFKGQKVAKSSLSAWKEFRGGKREVPLDMDQIAKECDLLLKEFPILEQYLISVLEPLKCTQGENDSLAGSLCGKQYATLVLSGLHSATAVSVVMEAFHEAVDLKDWPRALYILELYGQDNKELSRMRDLLLSCAVTDGDKGWQYLFRMQNAVLRGDLVLRCLDRWPLDECLEVLFYCISDPGTGEDLLSQLQFKKTELQIYEKILSLTSQPPWATWQELKEDSSSDPEKVMNVILSAKEYDLCESWVNLHPVSKELLVRLHISHLLHLLELEDSEKAFQLLQQRGDPDTNLIVCEQALDQRPGLAACHFLADYLTTHFYRSLSTERHHEIQAMRIGSKLLLTLPESARLDYSHLSSSPLLMLEQLLMNMKVDWAAVAVKTLHQLLVGQEAGFTVEDINNLLLKYAAMALHFPCASRERSRSDSVISLQDFLNQAVGQEVVQTSVSTETCPAIALGTSAFPVPQSPRERSQKRTKGNMEFVPPEKPPAKKDWVPDETEVACMVCKTERFTMFNRRHHCRRCGRLVCSSCSMKKMLIEGCRDNPVRVCNQCYNFCTKGSEEEQSDQTETVAGSPSSDALAFASMLQLPRAPELQWKLTLNENENELERSEFYFRQAPSASLCIALLEQHSNKVTCGHQLIEHCRKLSRSLSNPEVDARLLTDIMKQLLFSGKMMFVKVGRSQDLALCDSYISKVDVLKILVAANYKYVPSLDEIQQPAAVTRLRNQLLEAEYYQLAVEVSTKSGLDPTGVWHAWGMACLKAGNLSSAREKLSRCLKIPFDLNQLSQGTRHLQDVVQYLESAVKPVLSVPDDDILASLKELEATLKVESGGFEVMHEGKIQKNVYYQECLYYLHTFGTNLAIIGFYMRHDCMREALVHLLNKECPPEVFMDGVFIPSYENGKLHILEIQLEALDPSLESWSSYLIEACKHLQKRKFYNLLYDLQQFMKDYVRAAMTCIRFFSHKTESYVELGEKQKWLTRAKDHLKTYLQGMSTRSFGRKKSGSSFRKKMTAGDVTRHINTIELQIEVTRFLQRCESSGNTRNITFTPATLFGSNQMKEDVACKVMLGGKNIEEGFGIAFRIIQDFQLKAASVYNKAAKHLVTEHQYKEIKQLLKCVMESGEATKQDCDDIIFRCTEVADKGASEAKELESLILEIKSIDIRVKAYLMCCKLRPAYLIAVKQEPARAVHLVKEVLQVAEKIEDGVMQSICKQWLSEHQNKAVMKPILTAQR